MKKIVGSMRRGTGKDKPKIGGVGEDSERLDRQGTRNRDVEEFYTSPYAGQKEQRPTGRLADQLTYSTTTKYEDPHPAATPRDIALPLDNTNRKDKNLCLETAPIRSNFATNLSTAANSNPLKTGPRAEESRPETRWFSSEARIRQAGQFIDSPQAMTAPRLSRAESHESQYVDEPLIHDDRASIALAMNFVPYGNFSEYAGIVDEVQTEVFQKDKQKVLLAKTPRPVQTLSSPSSLPYRPVLESKLHSGASKEVLTAGLAAGARRSQDRERKEATLPLVVEERPDIPERTNTYPQQAARSRLGAWGRKETNSLQASDQKLARAGDGRGGDT